MGFWGLGKKDLAGTPIIAVSSAALGRVTATVPQIFPSRELSEAMPRLVTWVLASEQGILLSTPPQTCCPVISAQLQDPGQATAASNRDWWVARDHMGLLRPDSGTWAPFLCSGK